MQASLSSALRIWRLIDDKIFAPSDRYSVDRTRTLILTIFILRLSTRDWLQLASRHSALYKPMGLIRLVVPNAPSSLLIVVIQFTAVASIIGVLLGVQRRKLCIVAWCSTALLIGMWSSYGKTLHNDSLLLLATFPLLVGGIASRNERDESGARSNAWIIRSGLLVIASVYFITGVQKLTHSGFGWITSDNMRFVLYDAAANARAPTQVVSLFIADRPWLAHLSALFTILIEVGAPLLLLTKPGRLLFLLACFGLHGVTWLTMGLDYWTWVGVVAAFTLSEVGRGSSDRPRSRLRRERAPSAVARRC